MIGDPQPPQPQEPDGPPGRPDLPGPSAREEGPGSPRGAGRGSAGRGRASRPRADAPAAPGGSLLQRLVEEFERLPGIGRKSAERLAYHVLRQPAAEAMGLAYAIRDVKKGLRQCRQCFHIAEGELCSICQDETRSRATLCVVEQPKDVYAIEAAQAYRGLYHVLQGAISPLDGVSPRDLTVEALLHRVRGGEVEEVVIATNPDFEGDGTALLLHEKLRGIPGLRVTRLARGMPSGSHIEHVSRVIVSDAFEGRREMRPEG